MDAPSFDVICFSLEPWDEVWRRNQLLSAELLELRPTLRLLFAEQPVDMTWGVAHRTRPAPSKLRPIGETGRLWAMAPRKWLPRRVRPGADRALGRQVMVAAARLGFRQPVLWINDVTYASLAASGRPTVYDVTDDWVLSWNSDREAARQRDNDGLLLRQASQVVVCSPALAESRGQVRGVHLIPNGVDVQHMRRLQSRPSDLPDGPVLLYQGTLNEGRLEMDLCRALAESFRGRATFVLVGPDSLTADGRSSLLQAGAVLLGSRPYSAVPAYLQHADVLVVPHRATPFTESLDPIKAREFQAVARPVVSTPVAGFRDLGGPVVVAAPGQFIQTVERVLAAGPIPPGPGPLTDPPATWRQRAEAFLDVLDLTTAGQAASNPERMPGQ